MHRPCWRSSNHACWWRLADSGSSADQANGICRWIPPDLEATAQHYKNGVHLNNRVAKCELKVNFNNETLPFCSEPKNREVTLERSLTYRRHLQSLRKKLTSRVALLRRLAGSGWGAGATVLQTATLALVHSTAEYCAPVWSRSAHFQCWEFATGSPQNRKSATAEQTFSLRICDTQI